MKVTLSVFGRALLIKTPFPSLRERHKRHSHSKSKSDSSSKKQPEGHDDEHSHGGEDTSTEQFSASCSLETSDNLHEENLPETVRNGGFEKDANGKEAVDDDSGDDDDDYDDDDDSSYSSGSSLSSCSVGNDQEAFQRRREEFRHQERLQLQADGEGPSTDKDVQVFLNISKQLSNQSLIFLLQHHARQNMLNVIPEESLNAVLANEFADDKTSSSRGSHSSAITKTKQFRFAELANQQVRTIIHTIPRNDEEDDEEEKEVDYPIQRYWWTPEEYNACRGEAIRLVRFYRKYESEFIHSVEVLTQDDQSREQVEEEMKEMASLHAAARGMESHICNCLSSPRKYTIQAVLDVQEEMRQALDEEREKLKLHEQKSQRQAQEHQSENSVINNEGSDNNVDTKNESENINRNSITNTNDDQWMERMRQASLAASLPNRTYATRMGEFDHIEALKAGLSRWSRKSSRLASPRSVVVTSSAVKTSSTTSCWSPSFTG